MALCLGLRYRCANANANKDTVRKESQSAPFSCRHFPLTSRCLFLIDSLLVLYTPPPPTVSLFRITEVTPPLSGIQGAVSSPSRGGKRRPENKTMRLAPKEINWIKSCTSFLSGVGGGCGGWKEGGDKNNKNMKEKKKSSSRFDEHSHALLSLSHNSTIYFFFPSFTPPHPPCPLLFLLLQAISQ